MTVIKTLMFAALLMFGVYVIAQKYGSQPPSLPNVYPSAQAQETQSKTYHSPGDKALEIYGYWQAKRRDHMSDELQAFRDFKNYWQANVPSDIRPATIAKIYKRPEGVIPAPGAEAVAFKSKNIYDQFQEFLDQSYPQQKTGN